jgi:hypothetical protein
MSPKTTPPEFRLPHYTDLIPVVLAALKDLGGSGANADLNSASIKRLGIPETQLQAP